MIAATFFFLFRFTAMTTAATTIWHVSVYRCHASSTANNNMLPPMAQTTITSMDELLEPACWSEVPFNRNITAHKRSKK